MNSSVIEVRNELYTAHFLEDTMHWGLGAIRPRPEYDGTLDSLAQTVINSIATVDEDQMKYSCCTDGRCPLHLLTGERVPVREQLVGGDVMIGFMMAESLGNRFYSDPTAPVAVRAKEVVEFLQDNGYAGSHEDCGMAKSFVPVLQNIVELSKLQQFQDRTRYFLPTDVYESTLYDQTVRDIATRLDANMYDGYTGEMMIETAQQVAGQEAVAQLLDDGKGVHGHTEELIVRLERGIRRVAIDESAVFSYTHGREVFGVNDDRIERLAEVFGRGHDTDYKVSYIAGELATNGGHASLSRDLPTLIVSRIA